jgi:hypothetical protein
MAAVCLSMAACSGDSPSGDSRPTSASPRTPTTTSVEATPSPSPSPFESDRHAYAATIPGGWQVTEYEGEWTNLDQFSPGAEVPGEDVIAPSDLAAFLVMDSMAIPDGMSAEEWLEAFDDLVEEGASPDCSTTVDRGTFAGERATVVEQNCDGSVIVGRSLMHGGRGYYFTVVFPEGDKAAEATVDAILTSIRFTDD